MNGKNIVSAVVFVKSSNIDCLVYDGGDQVLKVTFKSGETYMYHEVPPVHFIVMLEAESVGAYFARNIKNAYRCEKIEEKKEDG